MNTIAAQREELERVLSTDPKPRPKPERRTPHGKRQVKLLEQVEAESAVTGHFTARVSDWQPDRQGERFARHAFDKAIAKLKADGRPLPVLYGHDQESVTAILGSVMSDDVEATDDGLMMSGWIDISTDVGKHVHAMLRRGALSWSIGFTLARSHLDRDGAKVLDEAGELLEVSAVPVPANERTATLGLKSDEYRHQPPSEAELRERCLDHGIPTDEHERVRVESRKAMFELFAVKAEEPRAPRHIELERRLIAEGILAPITATNEDLDKLTAESGSVTLHDANGHTALRDRKSLGDQPIRIASFDA